MVDSPADFHRLDSRLRLRGTLALQTALHVGAGKGSDGVDMPVLRDVEGYPFIPGASLKGVLRSTLESLVRALEPSRDQGLWACNPLEDEPGAPDVACGVYAKGERRGSVDVTGHCAICRLFGSRLVGSHVRISDALAKRRKGPPPIEHRDGVAIDRDRKVVHGGQKYDFEVVSPGTEFELEMFVENPRPWLMGLLIVGLDQIADGFSALGGFTSRGLGRATLQWDEVVRFTARDLLEGKGPTTLSKDDFARERDGWRDALAQKARP